MKYAGVCICTARQEDCDYVVLSPLGSKITEKVHVSCAGEQARENTFWLPVATNEKEVVVGCSPANRRRFLKLQSLVVEADSSVGGSVGGALV